MRTLEEWERAAAERLPALAYGYFRGGADRERTLRRNLDALAAATLWPRVLVDVTSANSTCTVLGCDAAAPILIAPTAYHDLAHPDGELATARGAAEAGSIYVVSTLATRRIEAIAAAAPGPKWLQLYVHRDRGRTRDLLDRAVASGYRAIVLTVDTPILGRRLFDEANRFHPPTAPNLFGDAPPGDGSALERILGDRHDASFSWRDLEWLRAATPLPILVKGVLRGDDAARACDAGCAGVIVSNHGGRQLDGAPATIRALPGVVAAVAGRAEVLIDGGFRWGSDVLVALALGARAVLLGRPIVWGLAVDGAAGVAAVLELLGDELRQAMRLAGCPRLDAIDRGLATLDP